MGKNCNLISCDRTNRLGFTQGEINFYYVHCIWCAYIEQGLNCTGFCLDLNTHALPRFAYGPASRLPIAEIFAPQYFKFRLPFRNWSNVPLCSTKPVTQFTSCELLIQLDGRQIKLTVSCFLSRLVALLTLCEKIKIDSINL